jgi:adenylate cyclase class IV
MSKEIELRVYDINRDAIVKKLDRCGAVFVGKYNFKIINFQLKTRGSIKSLKHERDDEKYYTSWIRIRTDGTNTTLTLKEQVGTTITGRTEYEVSVSDFLMVAKIIMKLKPSIRYAYAETEREEYKLGMATIDIDKRRGLPFSMEIEAPSERLVRETYTRLGIKKRPIKGIAVSDYKFYKLLGVDYNSIKREYSYKFKKMLEDFDKL